jgi:hypothetical protein
MPPSTRKTDARVEVKRALLGLGLGLVLVPVFVFGFGRLTLGPYEGTIGGFLGTLYLDLVKGAPGAVGLVLGPYGLYVLWRLTRVIAERAGR